MVLGAIHVVAEAEAKHHLEWRKRMRAPKVPEMDLVPDGREVVVPIASRGPLSISVGFVRLRPTADLVVTLPGVRFVPIAARWWRFSRDRSRREADCRKV